MLHFTNHTPPRAGRFYTVWLQQDLFGQWNLVWVHGSRQRAAVWRSMPVVSREEGERLMSEVVRVRVRHGYVQA